VITPPKRKRSPADSGPRRRPATKGRASIFPPKRLDAPKRDQPVRLQKLLADAGVASRRAAELLIAEGHVTVNGVVVREMGTSAVPGRDRVSVDGAPVHAPRHRTYLILNKPPGYTTTVRDPHAERTVMELLPKDLPRLYPAGRLDRQSEGLLLLTDDGEMAARLLHPRARVEREYAVLVRGTVTPGALERIRKGIEVEGATVVPVAVVQAPPPPPLSQFGPPGSRWLRITVREGRRREVRVMCGAVHLLVIRLVRIRLGPLELGPLPSGETRPLTQQEMKDLHDITKR